ncbi:MAG: sugar phosphate isomerase/epimerase [Verrucomicrobia bacterium]|jgi:sugar phosphate isomerase/epimerase|nr:sugar phosphate isomerase/epimerase [Verrucomicrobiota bacterium]
MAKSCYHASIEGAQHGAKSLAEFLAYARRHGAAGAQPSNYLLQSSKGFQSARQIKEAFARAKLKLDGVSAHCPFWVHTTAWTGSPSIRPFLPESVAKESPAKIEQWAEDYCLRVMDLCAELGIKVLPMFWGVAFGWEVATGYPWGFWKGPGFDLIQEGKERFVRKTAKLRQHARELGIYLCHEIHPGTGAVCAADFQTLVEICDDDACLGVNADPSHCWEGESWEQRFRAVGHRVYAAHVKNFVIRPGVALRTMESSWPARGMQFTDLPSGQLNLLRYAELLVNIGYPRRYCELMGTPTAPLVVEAESAYRDLDACSANGIEYVRDHLCFPLAAGSFEEGMGA